MNGGIWITLTWAEMIQAAVVGILRRINSLKKNRNEPHGKVEEPWGQDIESCGAEMAFGKYIGLYWESSPDTPHPSGDVGWFQVRHTLYQSGHLLLHKQDRDESPFVLVVGSGPRYRIVAWAWGVDGKKDKYWRDTDGRPAYWVPQSALNFDLDSLPIQPFKAKVNPDPLQPFTK